MIYRIQDSIYLLILTIYTIKKIKTKHKSFYFMQIQKSERSRLQFISRGTLESIYQQLGSVVNKHCGQIFYNYESILGLVEGLLRTDIPKRLESIIAPRLAQQLLSKYSPSAIIYAFMNKVFQYPLELVNFNKDERNRFFITNNPTSATVLLQTFINILDQRKIKFKQQALHLLQHTSTKMKENMEQMRKDPSIMTITQYCQDEISISSRVNFVQAQRAKYQPNELIYSSNASRDKGQFYIQLFQNMKMIFGQKFSSKLVEQVLLIFGAATYIETFKLQPKKINVQQPNNGFLMQVPFYGELANIDTFSLKIKFISAQPQTILEITLSFSPNIKLIPIGEFNLRQKALAAVLQKITDKQTVVQNLVYQMQKKSFLGKGSYGSVFRCDSLQLLQQQIKDQVRIFRFRRKNLAAKQLNLTQQERQKLLIPANRQHLILSLINQLRHREQINDCKRHLGFQVQSSLNGIQSIIPMIEYFKLEYKNEKNKGKQQVEHFFLTFQLGNKTLSNKDFLNTFARSQPFFENLELIFKKLFRGLSCLHYEIGRKYPFELNRYYCIQNNDDNNHEKDPQPSLVMKRKNGICLRDVKPSNMVVTFEGNRVSELWLIDFGMALICQITIRNGATSCGSEYFMSPEVRNGMRQDQRVDVWSAGVALFEMYSKDNRKLYSSIDVHVMNTVNNRINEQINSLSGDDEAWNGLMRAALTVKIENLKSSKEEIRKNSQEIVRYMDDRQFYLKKTDVNLLKQQFKQANVYRCMQISSNGNNQISFQQVNSGFEWEQINNYSLSHFCLRQYFRYSANSPHQSLKIALSCLLNAHKISPKISTDQLIIFLSQLQVLIANQFSQALQIIFIKNRNLSLQTKVNLELVRDMQQTISFVTFKDSIKNENIPVMLSTDIQIKQFQSDLINLYSQDSINYSHGYSYQQDKIKSRFYFVDEKIISDSTIIKEYTQSGRLFVTSTQVNRFEVLILKKLGDKYYIVADQAHNELLAIANEIIGFIKLQTEKYDYTVSFKEATNEFNRQNFAHLMQIEIINHNYLIIHYNKTTLTKILQSCQGVFHNEIKEIVSELLKEARININYQVKQALCLYLSSAQIAQFSKKSDRYSNFNLLTTDLKLFSQCLSFIFSQSTNIDKKRTKKIAQIVSQWMKMTEKYFQTTFGKIEANVECNGLKLKLHQQIRYVRSYCESITQMSTCQRFPVTFMQTACLGLMLSDHLDILKVFFDIIWQKTLDI